MRQVDDVLTGALERAIEAQLRNGAPIDATARALETSTRTLQRRLKRANLTYSDLVEQVRLRIAVGLLESTDLSMTAVAERLGYANISGFTRAFTRWTGMAPTRYRERLASGAPPSPSTHGERDGGEVLPQDR
jgi:AraC-like DNA-binding protein